MAVVNICTRKEYCESCGKQTDHRVKEYATGGDQIRCKECSTLHPTSYS